MKRFMTFALTASVLSCLLTMGTSAPAPAGEKMPASVALSQGGAQPDQVDINSASLEELRTLPGIGRAYSKKIMEHRPYKSVEELRTRKVLPQGIYAKVRDKIVAIGR